MSSLFSSINYSFPHIFTNLNLFPDGSLRISISTDVAGSTNTTEFSKQSRSFRSAPSKSRRHGRHQRLPSELTYKYTYFLSSTLHNSVKYLISANDSQVCISKQFRWFRFDSFDKIGYTLLWPFLEMISRELSLWSGTIIIVRAPTGYLADRISAVVFSYNLQPRNSSLYISWKE